MNCSEHAIRCVTLSAIAAVTLLLFGIADHEAWTPDEPRETLMSLDMANGSSWVVPELAGEPFVEKPPLYYWIVASAIRLLPETLNPAHVARSVSAACGLLILLITAGFVMSFSSRQNALLTAAILGTMTGFLELSHWIRIDSVLSVAVAGAALAGIAGLARGRAAWIVVACLCMGLAFMAKGLVAVALIAPAWIAAGWVNRDRFRMSWVGWPVGLIVMIVPPVLWIIAYRAEATAELWNEWFWVNQIGRFLGKTRHLGHIHGPFYYITALATVLLPWTPVLIDAGIQWKRIRESVQSDAFRRHWLPVLLWAAGGVLILSAAGTKRAIYLFPLLPAFAIIASTTADYVSRWVNYLLGIIIGVLIGIAGVLGVAEWNPSGRSGHLVVNPDLLTITLTILAVGLFWITRKVVLARTALVCSVVLIALILRIEPVLDRYKNYGPPFREFMQAIDPEMRPRICGWNLDQTTRASFPLYGNWRVETLRDPERLVQILENRDPEYDQVIIQLEKKAPVPDLPLPPWEVLIRKELMTGRVLGLIDGKR